MEWIPNEIVFYTFCVWSFYVLCPRNTDIHQLLSVYLYNRPVKAQIFCTVPCRTFFLGYNQFQNFKEWESCNSVMPQTSGQACQHESNSLILHWAICCSLTRTHTQRQSAQISQSWKQCALPVITRMAYGFVVSHCGDNREGILFSWCIYITTVSLFWDLSTLCVVDHLWPLIGRSLLCLLSALWLIRTSNV